MTHSTLKEEFDDSVMSWGSMTECPDCGAVVPSREQTDFASNIRREFPKSLNGCRRCGFNGVVYARFDSEMERVEEQIIRERGQKADA